VCVCACVYIGERCGLCEIFVAARVAIKSQSGSYEPDSDLPKLTNRRSRSAGFCDLQPAGAAGRRSRQPTSRLEPT
jgi:hypothetical protein